MDNPISSIEFKVEPTDHQRLSLLCGPFDDHIRQIERHFRVQLSFRDDKFRLLGLTEQLPLVQQLVHHIADSHMNAFTRFKLGLTDDKF